MTKASLPLTGYPWANTAWKSKGQMNPGFTICGRFPFKTSSFLWTTPENPTHSTKNQRPSQICIVSWERFFALQSCQRPAQRFWQQQRQERSDQKRRTQQRESRADPVMYCQSPNGKRCGGGKSTANVVAETHGSRADFARKN